MRKSCGYSFWGYLGDNKFTRKGKVASTPDGNAFYSWCIIKELQSRGYDVIQVMPDRDEVGYDMFGMDLFRSWCPETRLAAYLKTRKIDWWHIIDECRDNVIANGHDSRILVDKLKRKVLIMMDRVLGDTEFILHEYRMLIPGRNDYDMILSERWQPDYLIQQCLFEYCIEKNKKLILFDLDYKLSYGVYRNLKDSGCPVCIFELGNKWSIENDYVGDIKFKTVYIPFDFNEINYFPLTYDRCTDAIYVGNRYERDWCIDKYIPNIPCSFIVYGNWLEGGRDSDKKWPHVAFFNRLQTSGMRDAYADSVATILFAKKEYCQYGFMTARIIESIFYGAVPLFISEYGDKLIQQYAGDYADFLTVNGAFDVCDRVHRLRELSGGAWINIIIKYLRDRLSFMDVEFFVDAIEEVIHDL